MDSHVLALIHRYDIDEDGALNLHEFLNFYYQAASNVEGGNLNACYENLKNMGVRNDLMTLEEVVVPTLFSEKEMMPRYAI